MTNITRDLYAILLLIAVLYTSAYAEEEIEDETLSTDRNSLTSIRLPSKCRTGKKKNIGEFSVALGMGATAFGRAPPPKKKGLDVFQTLYQYTLYVNSYIASTILSA